MPEPIEEPALDPDSERLVRRGVAEFNAGKYFECHDTLEEVWQGTRGPARNFLQGLIQVSVAFYHLRHGNLTGGESQLEKATRNLSVYGDRYLGVNLATLRRELEPWRIMLRAGTPPGKNLPKLPRIDLGFPDERER